LDGWNQKFILLFLKRERFPLIIPLWRYFVSARTFLTVQRSMNVFGRLRPFYSQKSSETVRDGERSETFAKSCSQYGHGTFTFQKRKNYCNERWLFMWIFFIFSFKCLDLQYLKAFWNILGNKASNKAFYTLLVLRKDRKISLLFIYFV